MTSETLRDGVQPWGVALWATIFIGVPFVVAASSGNFAGVSHPGTPSMDRGLRSIHPMAGTPPRVEPLEVLRIAPDDARAINASIPFSGLPNAPARPFLFGGETTSRARATDCLAAAQYYEAGDDSSGQEAVAQVIINRMRHPAFPKTICGVVFQGSERKTGCQFTFTCDGALARHPSQTAWERARTLAARMLSGRVDSRVGLATHYHTNWVVPYWSSSLEKITSVDSHLFFRWKVPWGRSGAFRGVQQGAEPAIVRLSFLSPMHATGMAAPSSVPNAIASLPEFADAAYPAAIIGPDRIGNRFGPARLVAINSAGDAFVMQMDRGTQPEAFETLARKMCAGRINCRVLGWNRGSATPSRFPIADTMLANMNYAYMRAATNRLERTLFNCREFPEQPTHRCMRERVPVVRQKAPVPPPSSSPMPLPAIPLASPAPRLPRTGSETVRLTQ